ncbi:MAG: hypothetical protein HY078_08515 [Elusimicrobia bacterium]|nr:hypothetical protein [Elusimicrobiota bacterium]
MLGEHGDSEFVAWSTVFAGGVNVRKWSGYSWEEIDALERRVRTAAYEIIKRKKATYFAIGAAVSSVLDAVLNDRGRVIPISTPLEGQYGLRGVCLSLPCVLGARGIERVLEPELESGERESLRKSGDVLRNAMEGAWQFRTSPLRCLAPSL